MAVVLTGNQISLFASQYLGGALGNQVGLLLGGLPNPSAAALVTGPLQPYFVNAGGRIVMGGFMAQVMPFAPTQININIYNNPFGSIGQPAANPAAAQQAAPQNQFQQLLDMLNKLLQALTGQLNTASAGASGAASGGSGTGASSAYSSGSSSSAGSASGASGGSGLDDMVSSVGGSIDSMMSQAEGLLKSDKMSDQLKGQMLMQRAMRLFEMISKLLEQRSQMASKAIQAIK